MITATNPTTFDIHFPAEAAPGVAPYSARGLRGTLSLVDHITGGLRRTVNGTLVDLSPPQMRKYRLEIAGQDQAPPALDGVWPGMPVTVDAMVELAYLTAGGSPSRTPVSGSSRTEGDYTYYSPQFQMLVVECQLDRSEWAAEVSWSLTLEEV